MQVLIFSYLDCRFAIEIDNIAYLYEYDGAKNGIWFHEILFETSAKAYSYDKPYMLTWKGEGSLRPLIINQPDDILEIDRNNILTVPAVIAPLAGPLGVSGFIRQELELICLMYVPKNDKYRRLSQENPGIS